jgi:restriction endonuclease S subunit
MAQISLIKKSDIENAERFDAEYFKSEYLEIERKLKKIDSKYLYDFLGKGNIICGPFGSAILNSDYKDIGTPLLRVLNLHDFFLSTENLKYLNEDKVKKLPRYIVRKGDIVVSQRGSVSEFSLIEKEGKYIISANLISIKNSNKNFYYLITFLNSRYGKKQLEKTITGQVQEKITTSDIKNLKIPILPQFFQFQIEKIVKQAHEKQQQAKQLYTEAEQILLTELDLLDFKPKQKLAFSTTKSNIEKAERFDSEYFQPKYSQIIEKITNYHSGFDSVKNIIKWKKGIEVGSDKYTENGKSFVRVSDFSINGIDSVNKKIDNEYFAELKDDFQAKKDEILFTKDGTIGISYLLKNDIDGVVSSAFLRLTMQDKYNNFEKECLTLIFNSIICKQQIERLSGGAIIAHLKPSDFEKLQIPLITQSIQTTIADKITLSHTLRQESKNLLEQAKLKVEQEIERAAENNS